MNSEMANQMELRDVWLQCTHNSLRWAINFNKYSMNERVKSCWSWCFFFVSIAQSQCAMFDDSWRRFMSFLWALISSCDLIEYSQKIVYGLYGFPEFSIHNLFFLAKNFKETMRFCLMHINILECELTPREERQFGSLCISRHIVLTSVSVESVLIKCSKRKQLTDANVVFDK